MPSAKTAAIFAIALLACLGLFQLALALGAPWGRFAMGGAFEGVYPPAMRLAALAQIAIYAVHAAVIAARAGLRFAFLAGASRWLIWVFVALSAVSTLLNAISPSRGESLIWTPVAILLTLACLRVALSKERLPV